MKKIILSKLESTQSILQVFFFTPLKAVFFGFPLLFAWFFVESAETIRYLILYAPQSEIVSFALKVSFLIYIVTVFHGIFGDAVRYHLKNKS